MPVGISDEQSYSGLCCLQLSGFFGDSVNCTIYLNKSFFFSFKQLIIFFAAKDGEALYSQQKQDQELTVAQIMNSLLPNLDLN